MAYQVVWTTKANRHVLEQYQWLHQFWTSKEVNQLSQEINRTVGLTAQNPQIFKESNVPRLRVAVVLRLNKIYYRVLLDQIRNIAFYPTRKKPLE